MRTVSINCCGIKNQLDGIELTFKEVLAECSNPLCAKSYDVIGSDAGHLNLDFSQLVLTMEGSTPVLCATCNATCPYCGRHTTIKINLNVTKNALSFGKISKNIIRTECITPDGPRSYMRSDNPIDDPGFNFIENINKGEPAYVYDQDDSSEVDVLTALFVVKGDACYAKTMPDELGIYDTVILHGPLAILDDGFVALSNKTVTQFYEISDSDGDIIAPDSNAYCFEDHLVFCHANSPLWTRIRQTTLVETKNGRK